MQRDHLIFVKGTILEFKEKLVTFVVPIWPFSNPEKSLKLVLYSYVCLLKLSNQILTLKDPNAL